MIFQAKVNIPGVSDRTLRRSIAASDISLSADIQVCINIHHLRSYMAIRSYVSTSSCITYVASN